VALVGQTLPVRFPLVRLSMVWVQHRRAAPDDEDGEGVSLVEVSMRRINAYGVLQPS
jgi:hypothetical protein